MEGYKSLANFFKSVKRLQPAANKPQRVKSAAGFGRRIQRKASEVKCQNFVESDTSIYYSGSNLKAKFPNETKVSTLKKTKGSLTQRNLSVSLGSISNRHSPQTKNLIHSSTRRNIQDLLEHQRVYESMIKDTVRNILAYSDNPRKLRNNLS